MPGADKDADGGRGHLFGGDDRVLCELGIAIIIGQQGRPLLRKRGGDRIERDAGELKLIAVIIAEYTTLVAQRGGELHAGMI